MEKKQSKYVSEALSEKYSWDPDENEKPISLDASVRIRAYEVIERAMESAVGYGMRRAYKHTDDPSKVEIESAVLRAVMDELCSVLIFGDNDF